MTLTPCIHRKRELSGRVECCSNRLVPLPPAGGSIIRPMSACLSPCPYTDVPNIDVLPRQDTDWSQCSHRGEQLRTAKCRTCGNRNEQVPIYRCAVYGECSIHMRDIKKADSIERVGVCAGCERFTEGE